MNYASLLWNLGTQELRRSRALSLASAPYSSFLRVVFHCIRDIGILERSVVCGQDSTYQKDQIQRRYFNTHQRPNQTIEDYYEYFQEVLRNFNDIGLKKPKRSEQIVRFLASLNRDLYVDLHRDINNSPQHNILKFKTLQEAYAFAVHYQPSTSSPLVASSVNPVVIPTLELEHLEIRTSSHHISQRKHTKSDELEALRQFATLLLLETGCPLHSWRDAEILDRCCLFHKQRKEWRHRTS
jgi:hypothetical protein